MTLTGNENHSITLAEGAAMTKNYRDTITTGAVIAHSFGKTSIVDLLAQTGCVGVRLYYAISSTSVKELVAVGVDQYGNDLYQGIILDRTIKCPQDCPAANPLNTNVTG